jgi:hypothetical protein
VVDVLTFPDAEAAAAYILRSAGIPGLNGVYSSLPNDPNWPVAVVERVPSTPADRYSLDRAAIQVSVWGNTQAEAHDIAQEARAELVRAEGTTLWEDAGAPVDCEITAVRDDLGVFRLPDALSKKDRYVFQVSLYVRGLAPVFES